MRFSVIILDRIDSTNAFARRLIKQSGAVEGKVIWAREQYEGRGQGENSWHSKPGMNLTFSLILEPSFLQPDKQFIFNKAIALAVMNSVKQSLSPDATTLIKWPNDIYAGNRKIAGILIEHTIMGNALKHSIAGIGINLNQVEFPTDLPNHEPKKFLENVCRNIDHEYTRLIKREFASINDDYNCSLFGCGSELEFASGSSSFTGRIKGVDNLGRLLVLTAGGAVRAFTHGEIRF
jgi:BirA family biotin operon repressor/biotin-[acetyl-CoA-carboxylase] ligase